MSDIERSEFFRCEIKAGVDAEGVFEGYASTFGNIDLQGDVVLPGAFADTIRKHGGVWPFLMAHQLGVPVGYTMEAAEDAKGLRFKAQFTPSDEGRNARESVMHGLRLGHKPGVSIGYRIPKNGSEWDDQTGIRTLKTIELLEISLAMVPANPRARISGAKAAGEWTIREFEDHLREVGFSKDAARAIASRGYAALDRRDADAAAEEKRAADAFMAELRSAAFIFELQKVR